MIHLGETLPKDLAPERRDIQWSALALLTSVLFPCSLISFGIGAPTGVCQLMVHTIAVPQSCQSCGPSAPLCCIRM